MSERKVKKGYIIAGILFALCTIRAFYFLISILCSESSLPLDTYILSLLWPLMLSAYCFVFRQKKRTGTVLYCLSLAVIFFLDGNLLYFFGGYYIHWSLIWSLIFTILICTSLLIAKFRKENVLILISTALMIVYTIDSLYWIVSNIITNSYLLWCISSIALIFLWWLEGGHRIVDIIKGWKQTKQQFATLETSLRSLKEQFEAGQITQEEYDEQRKELLAQL